MPSTQDIGASSAILRPGHNHVSVSDKIGSIVLAQRRRTGWLIGFAFSFLLLMVLLFSTAYLLAEGVNGST